MPYILLTRGKRVRVDPEDYAELNQHMWYAQSRCDRRAFHAARCITRSGRQITIRMHRQILGLRHRDGQIVDHVNGNTLDNRRCNLRVCSSSDNNCNCGNYRGGTSSYKGVRWHAQHQKWYTSIQKNGKSSFLGLFKSETKAAQAYDAAAKRIHGPFAYSNFPDSIPQEESCDSHPTP